MLRFLGSGPQFLRRKKVALLCYDPLPTSLMPLGRQKHQRKQERERVCEREREREREREIPRSVKIPCLFLTVITLEIRRGQNNEID